MSHACRTSIAAPLAAFLLLAAPGAASAGGEAARTAAAADPALPAMLRLALARSQAADVGVAYQLDRDGRGANPRHRLDLAFTPRGARIDGPSGGFALHLERFGRGAGQPVRQAAPRVDGAWVEYDRGAGLSEWFVNLPRGVEQGWTVTERPAGDGPLMLELDTARPPEESDDRRLAWSGLVYHRLVALDAGGRKLPVSWNHDGDRLRIAVDDRDAAYPVLIDPWVQQAKLVADDAAAGDEFGVSVALAGDTALVGAFLADVDVTVDQGAAYVFVRSGGEWIQQAKLTADDGALGDAFGLSVALAGDTALVGAPFAAVGDNSAQGAAYVFTRSGGTWSQQVKLVADDGAVQDSFGVTVALAGDTALVAAFLADVDDTVDQGAAYVFVRSGGEWSEQAKLSADDGAVGDAFGFPVAVAGDTALVGAPFADVGGNADQGAAYVFVRSGGEWGQQAKLTADDGAAFDDFGVALALAGDTALVGAYFADVGGNADQGAVYVFTRSGETWSQHAKLVADDGAVGHRFGSSVALAGDTALVGAYFAHVGGNFAQGAAYVFTRGGDLWTQRAKLVADDGVAGDNFGRSIAFADDTALVGAPTADVGGDIGEGAAYVFVPPLTSVALAVDPEPKASDGNRVFEPGEQVTVAPSWRNESDVPLTVAGDASSFTGPAGATYELVLTDADYGTVAPGVIASCQDTGVCYALEVDDPAVRPALHWDATFDETLTVPEALPTTRTLHFGDSFADVPRTSPFYSWIETLLHHGVTGGCGATAYCPAAANTRDQMPVFLLKARLGRAYTPPACVDGEEMFADVPFSSPFCRWIEELAGRGVTAGCGGGNYCPGNPVNRDQMAVFLLKTLEGPGYAPPACTGVFGDVPCPSLFASWIEDLVARGITAGCGGGNYCPSNPVSRDQMAVFLAKTFGLTLYGP